MKTGLVNGTLLSALLLVSIAFAEAVPIEPRDDGEAVRALPYARHFRLEEPYVYSWTSEPQPIESGYILVLEVEPEFAKPRQIDLPVLYVGHLPAELTNSGYPDGRMVVIVPGSVNLAEAPVFFGSTELPERVDLARGRAEMEAALAMGITPFPAEEIAAALLAGGPTLQAEDSVSLYRTVADVIDEFAPSESARAESYRVSRVGD